MQDRLDIQEPQPQPKPTPEASRRKMTPHEARKSYGIRTAILGAAMLWFGYDGWFNPKIEAKMFNKVGAVLLAIGFVFYLVLFASAALTVHRLQQSGGDNRTPPQG